MQSLKMFLVSAFASVVIFSSQTVLAQEVLIDTIPDFYFLEESMESSVETITIRACNHALSASATSPSADIQTLGLDCFAIVEVDKADLNQFIVDLNLDVQSFHKDFYLPIAGSGSLTVLSIIPLFKKFSFQSKIARFVTNPGVAVISLPIMGMTTLVLFVNSYDKGKHSSALLRKQIHSGLVTTTKDSSKTILKQFTNFLNEHGTLLIE